MNGVVVSRLSNLIASARAKDPKLGEDLDREFKVLTNVAFRHTVPVASFDSGR